jgi:hypothetical protein
MARKPLNSAETIRRINAKNSGKPQKKTAWKDLPDHVKLNIQRAKSAEAERQKIGGKLPTATFVSGGKVSSK